MGRKLEEELRVRARQQAVVAELGQRALAGIDLATLMDEAVERVAETLHVEYSKVLELLPGGEALLLRAGVGWQAGLVGQATVSAGLESQAGYTLLSSEPVIVEDLSTETRFSGPPLLHDHGVVSGISVIIQGEGRPFGVMGAHTARRRTFTPDDTHFLQATANVLAEAIQRKRAEEVVRESEARFRVLTEHALAGVYLIQDDRFRYVNPALAAMFGYTPEELIGRLGPVDLTAPDDRERVAENVRRRIAGEAESLHYTFQGLRKDGTLFECEALGSRGEHNGRPAVLGMLLDITERKRAEERQAHFQSLLKALSEVNQLIVRARDPQAMLQEACQILRRTRGYAGLWIGLLDEAGQHLHQVAGAGIAADVEPVDISLDEPGPPLYCARTALAERRPSLVKDVKESHPCVTCSYRATVPHAGTLAVPLLHREGCYGALVVYTERPWAFHEDETELLSELANDLALGLYTLEADEKLRQSEEKYRLLVENANEAIVVAQDGRLKFFNPKTMEITGYAQEELASMPFVELIHPDDQQMVVENHLKRLAGETLPQTYPFRIVDSGGNTKWVEINAVVIDWEGKPATLNLLTDITERKQAEEALRESEARYRTLVEASLQGIIIVQDFKVAYANPAFARMSGYTVEELLALSPDQVQALVHPEDQASVWSRYRDRLAGRAQPPEYVYRGVRKDGAVVWLEMYATRIEYGGRPAVQAAIVDVTERVQAEEELKEYSERLEEMVDERTAELAYRAGQLEHLRELDASLLGATSLEATLQLLAKGAVTHLGYDGAAVGLYQPEEQSLVVPAIYPLDSRIEKLRSLAGVPGPGALRFSLSGKGTLFDRVLAGETMLANSLTQFLDAPLSRVVAQGLQKLYRFGCVQFVPLAVEGEVVGVLIGVVREQEPSARKQAGLALLAGHAALAIQQAQLREAEQQRTAQLEATLSELEQAQEQLVRQEKLATLGQLAGAMAHELRNPLGAISNAAYYLNLVLEEPQPAVKETLEILDKEVRTSEKIISSLLDFARTRPPIRQAVNVNALVREALARAGVPANIQVTTHLDETLPAIQADPDQLAQVFDNLIRNAVQAMPDGGQLSVNSHQSSVISNQLSVISSPSTDDCSLITDNWILITVTDTGVGIPPENLDRLFEPLFTTKAKGIGLGLALCKMLVEGHGGTIEVESEVGKGSTFTVNLI